MQQRVEEDEFLAEEDELGRANGGNVDKRERLKRYAADWKALPDDDEVKMRLKANIKVNICARARACVLVCAL